MREKLTEVCEAKHVSLGLRQDKPYFRVDDDLPSLLALRQRGSQVIYACGRN